MLFSKKWLRNHPQLLLYFLIHIDVFMLCRKFELILTSNFQVMACTIAHAFFQKMAPKSPPIFIIFFDTY